MPDEPNPQGGDNKADALQKLLDKNNGDAMCVVGLLFSENYDLREKNRQLKEAAPKDGSHVLTADEFKLYEAAKATGLKPEEFKPKLESAATLEAENATLKREGQLRAVEKTGWNFDALKDFDALEPGLEYFVKDETKDNKPIKVAYVKKGDKETPLEEYATEKRPHLLSALREGGSAQQKGTEWATQGGGQKPAPKKPAEGYISSTYSAPKPRSAQA